MICEMHARATFFLLAFCDFGTTLIDDVGELPLQRFDLGSRRAYLPATAALFGYQECRVPQFMRKFIE